MSGSYKQFQELHFDENRKNLLGSACNDRIIISHVVVGCKTPSLTCLFLTTNLAYGQ